MKAIRMGALVAMLTVTPAFAAPQTWTGQISDSMCGVTHMASEHGTKVSDKPCTQMCVNKGAKYVLVSEGKVLAIVNQEFKGLAPHAGETVRLTGELKGNAITVSKVEKAVKASN